MGDRVDPDAWNLALGPLLPRRLRLPKTAVEPSAPDAPTRAARLASASATHPVLQPFIGQAKEGLFAARFYRYVLLEPGAGQGDDEVLATLDDGAPALAAAKRGKGRVLLFTSTVDRDWSDFAIRTSFLPFVQRACSWLAGSLDEREELKVKVGETVALPKGAVVAQLKSPSGKELPVARQGEVRLVGPLDRAGRLPGARRDGAARALGLLRRGAGAVGERPHPPRPRRGVGLVRRRDGAGGRVGGARGQGAGVDVADSRRGARLLLRGRAAEELSESLRRYRASTSHAAASSASSSVSPPASCVTQRSVTLV